MKKPPDPPGSPWCAELDAANALSPRESLPYTHKLQEAVDRLLRAADLAHETAERHDDNMSQVDVGEDEWLAAVVICLADGWDGDLKKSMWAVEDNREPCLVAKSSGFEPWEIAQFIQMNTRPSR